MRYEVIPADVNNAEDVRTAELAQRLLDSVPDEVQARITQQWFQAFMRTDEHDGEEVASRAARDWLKSQR